MGATEERIRQQSVRLMETKLDQGLCIAVVGWRDSNHDSFTRSLDQNKFRFLDNKARGIPWQKTGYALLTRFVDHDVQQQLQDRGIPTHVRTVANGVIKDMLREVSARIPSFPLNIPEKKVSTAQRPAPASLSILPTSPSQPAADKTVTVVAPPPPSPLATPKVELPGLSRGEKERNFAVAFLKAVGGDRNRTVSKYECSRLLGEHFGESAKTPSQFKKLLDGVVAEGAKNVGQYRATDLLVALAGHGDDAEPNAPIEKAQWLLRHETIWRAQKRALEEEVERLTAELRESIKAIDADLQRCAKAKSALTAFEQSFRNI